LLFSIAGDAADGFFHLASDIAGRASYTVFVHKILPRKGSAALRRFLRQPGNVSHISMFPSRRVLILYCGIALLETRMPESKEPNVGQDIWFYNTPAAPRRLVDKATSGIKHP
jgi:hypothetical protein